MVNDPTAEAGTIPNKQRGCGFLEHGKAYLRSPPRSPDGVLPPFVEFSPYVPYLEREKFRGYEHFPGVQFEVAVTGGPDLREGLNDEQYGMQHIHDEEGEAFLPGARSTLDSVDGGFSTDPPGEVYRHIARLVGSADGDHAGEITAFSAHDLYMHIGKSYYENPAGFIREVRTQGLSKAIPVSESHAPPAINPGLTRVFLVHPEAVPVGDEEDPDYEPGIIGYVFLSRVVYTASKSGEFPKWAQDYARTGDLDLVHIGDRVFDDGTRATTVDEEEAFGPKDDEAEPVDPEPAPAGTDRPCPYCHETNLMEDSRGIYCPACGTTLGGESADDHTTETDT